MTIGKLEDMGLLCRSGRNLAPTHAFSLMTDNHSRFAKIQCALFKGNGDIKTVIQRFIFGDIAIKGV